jgi:replicative DNA helicase
MSAAVATAGRREGELGPLVGRVPPNDLDAEAAVLSAVLLSPDAFDLIAETLRPEHCYSNANRLLLEAVVDLHASGKPVDMVAVAGWLRDRGRLAQVGGTAYIAQLVDATPAVANAEQHARTVREKWRLRQLIQTCQRFAGEGYGNCGDVQSFIDQAEQAVYEVARLVERSSVTPVKDSIVEAFRVLTTATERGGAVPGVRSGFSDLDRKTTGFRVGDLIILSARPGMGKTALALDFARAVARERPEPAQLGFDHAPVTTDGDPVAYIGLEMPKDQIASRLLASESRVDLQRIRSGSPRNEDWNKLTEAAARIGRWPLYLDFAPGLTLLELRSKIRRLQAELRREGKKLSLVIVDYLQLMRAPDADTREQAVAKLSLGLKQLAGELEVPIVVLAQLNRELERRSGKDKRPQLSDLRESGAIEQDADLVLFIYRDEYYHREDSAERGIAEVIIAKQRNGPTGMLKLKFSSECTRFDNLIGGFDEFDEFQDRGGRECLDHGQEEIPY